MHVKKPENKKEHFENISACILGTHHTYENTKIKTQRPSAKITKRRQYIRPTLYSDFSTRKKENFILEVLYVN